MDISLGSMPRLSWSAPKKRKRINLGAQAKITKKERFVNVPE
jgi:hypothetical protein